MAKELEITAKYASSIRDSDTGASCVTKKVIDVTRDCPRTSKENQRCLFLYTQAKRGRIIQMCLPYEGEELMGMKIHFFVDELAREMRVAPCNDTFGSWANRLGLSKSNLRLLIETHAPSP